MILVHQTFAGVPCERKKTGHEEVVPHGELKKLIIKHKKKSERNTVNSQTYGKA